MELTVNSVIFASILEKIEDLKLHTVKSSLSAESKTPAGRRNIFVRVFRFYYEGFRSMTLGKTLWLLILIKLFIMFAILKIFFFPNFLNTNFDTDQARSEHVLEELTRGNGK